MPSVPSEPFTEGVRNPGLILSWTVVVRWEVGQKWHGLGSCAQLVPASPHSRGEAPRLPLLVSGHVVMVVGRGLHVAVCVMVSRACLVPALRSLVT